ncbi:uncharacterized protein TNCV_1162541 [Trichonephila clavipes]|nr:uncharacterized protein TNCV_1162541 [Trichonephila clavipes]
MNNIMFACTWFQTCYHLNKRNENMPRDLIHMANEDDRFLQKIVTGDETWCFLNNPQTKCQSSDWKAKTSPKKRNFACDKSRGKMQ